MKNLISKIDYINDILIDRRYLSKDYSNLGLFHGKMGLAIYVFNLARLTNSSVHQNYAEELIDSLYEDIHNRLPCDFANGLVGIGFGFNYIIKNKFVEGDVKEVLQDVDDRIFKSVVFDEKLELHDLIETGLYFLHRLGHNCEYTILVKELIISIVNRVSTIIMTNPNNLKDPAEFNLRWILPNLLLFLTKILKEGFYNSKVTKFIDELTPHIISLLPILDANKTHMYYAISKLVPQYNREDLVRYSKILKNTISVPRVIKYEFKDKSIDLQYGLTGYSYILKSLNWNKFSHEKMSFDELILIKILNSSLWDKIANQDNFAPESLANGFTGVGIELLRWFDGSGLKQENKKIECYD